MNSGFVDRNWPPGRENTGFPAQEHVSARDCVTVSELNRVVAQTLIRNFPMVWVRGEVSNLTRAASGHCYFSLKDSGAQVRCVMFRHRVQALGFSLREGARVDLRAAVSLYEPRGDFQLNVESMRQTGSGDLFQAFLALKAKLQAEGLFDAERKKPLPAVVHVLGVVTSLQAAALRDVLATLRVRAPQVKVIVYPSPVQGAEAPASLAKAVRLAGLRDEVDALLIVRGGGSMEDLWAFNDENLARVIASSHLATISGVGHETDFTICDFVADFRAPTPTAAASLACSDRREVLRSIEVIGRALARAMRQRYENSEQSLDLAARLLRSPADALAHDRRRLDHLGQQLHSAMRARFDRPRLTISMAENRLRPERLRQELTRRTQILERTALTAQSQMRAFLQWRSQALDSLEQQLQLVSPLAVLERGYAIVRDAGSGRVVRRLTDSQPGQQVQLMLSDGQVGAKINSA